MLPTAGPSDRYGLVRRRLLSLAALVFVAGAIVPVAGGGVAEAATHTVASVTPPSSTKTVGQSQTLVATIDPPTTIQESVVVAFKVISGPNSGLSLPSCTVDAGPLGLGGNTQCSALYSSTLAGTDTILVTAGPGDAGKQVTVTWQGIPAFVNLSPQVSFNTVGNNLQVIATVTDSHGAPIPGATLALSTSGPGSEPSHTGSATSDASGNATFSFTSGTRGKMTVTVSADRSPAAPVTGSITSNWAGPPTSIVLTQQRPGGRAPVGATDTVTAQVTDVDHNLVGDNTTITFTVTGAGSTTGTGLTSGGGVGFSFRSTVTGTSTITATYGSVSSNAVTATWEVPVPTSITLTPKQTAKIVGNQQLLVAEVFDQFNQDLSGALVRFLVGGANAQPFTFSGTTGPDGKTGFIDTGNNIGVDTIYAFVDLQNSQTLDPGDPYDVANIIWLRKLGQGYWMVASDGGVFNYGPSATFQGSAGAIKLNQPIVGMSGSATGFGYWLVASDGGIFNYGDAAFLGSAGAIKLNKPIVGMARTPDGGGYWLVASDGGIFNYGTAKFYGSTGAIKLNKPIVGIAPTATGAGYWLVASDGGIFAFGDAAFKGSSGAIKLNAPIVGMAPSGSGAGYWLAASDGGIFNYGDAAFFGSAGAIKLNAPIVGIAGMPDGTGYTLAASDGGVFNYGSPNFGSAGGSPLNKPVVGIATAP